MASHSAEPQPSFPQCCRVQLSRLQEPLMSCEMLRHFTPDQSFILSLASG